MKQLHVASVDAIPLTYFNPFGLPVVPLVGDRNGLPRLSVNDLIFDLAQGRCPPRFSDWYTVRHTEYRGRLPWKFLPEYAQLPEYDVGTMEDFLHYLEVGRVPETELMLYFLIHAMDWGHEKNPVFVLMQKAVGALMQQRYIKAEDKDAVILQLVECVREEFDRYMTIDTDWAMAVKKQQLEEISLPSEDWELVDKKINPHGYPLLAMVRDRAGHPIPDLNDLHQAMVERTMLPGFIMNPYDLRRECQSDDYGLLAILPEYVLTQEYDFLGLIALLCEVGVTDWKHICIVVHLANYGMKGSPVLQVIQEMKGRVNNPNIPTVAHPFNYLMKMIRGKKILTILAPRKFKN
ncbi:MAG TPA: hypothetical protein PLK40_10055 [Bacteroidaceae bacterium]|nr:hypothetical protein [Bacteroidaceae bacterium]